MSALPATVVLGLGDPQGTDAAFGSRCVEALERGFVLPRPVMATTGCGRRLGTPSALPAARRLILVDAVALGGTPGDLRVLRDGDVPRSLVRRAVGTHPAQGGSLPADLVLVALEPVGRGAAAGDTVIAAQVRRAVHFVVTLLIDWGHLVVRRPAPFDRGRPDLAGEASRPFAPSQPMAETGRGAAEARCFQADR